MRGVAGLELHGQSAEPSPPADGGTSAAAAPTRTAFAGIRAGAPPWCPRRAGCRPRGCGQRYGLPLGVDESATGPMVAILRERQPDVLLTHVANAPVPPGPQPSTGDHPAGAQDRPGPRPPPRTRPLVAAQGFQFEPRRPQVCEAHPDLLLDITPVSDAETKAMDCMTAQGHMVRADSNGLPCLFVRGLSAGHGEGRPRPGERARRGRGHHRPTYLTTQYRTA